MKPADLINPGKLSQISNNNKAGTYALILQACKPIKMRVGRLGWMLVRPGFYVYTGSAFGPGGLQARLGRHLIAAALATWFIFLKSLKLRISKPPFPNQDFRTPASSAGFPVCF